MSPYRRRVCRLWAISPYPVSFRATGYSESESDTNAESLYRRIQTWERRGKHADGKHMDSGTGKKVKISRAHRDGSIETDYDFSPMKTSAPVPITWAPSALCSLHKVECKKLCLRYLKVNA